MGIGALVPVQEGLKVDAVANVQGLHRPVDLGLLIAEIVLHAELVGLAVLGELEVQVVGLVLRVLVGEGGAALVARLNGHALEGHQPVLMLDQPIVTQQGGHVLGLGQEGLRLQDLKDGVGDLHLAGPLGLVAGDADLGARDQQLILLLAAGHVVQEVGAVLALAVEGGLVLPPGLFSLDVGLHGDFGVQLRGGIVGIAHDGGLRPGGLAPGAQAQDQQQGQ